MCTTWGSRAGGGSEVKRVSMLRANVPTDEADYVQYIAGGLEVAPQLESGAPETGASEQGGEEGGRL